MEQEKNCSKCNKKKNISDFYKSSSYYHSECKECNRKYYRDWYKDNKEKKRSDLMMCECGKVIQKSYYEQHKLTKLHRKEKPSFMKCECGKVIQENYYEQHKLTDLHFVNMYELTKLHKKRPGVIECECGAVIQENDYEEHTLTDLHFENMYNSYIL